MAENFLLQELNRTFRGGSMIRRLIVVNILIFLVLHLASLIFFLSNSLYSVEDAFVRPYMAVPSNVIDLLHRPWTLITYEFTHYEFLHILFNMLWLYWLGTIFTEFLGNKKVLPVYLMGSWFGAAMFILCYNLFPVFKIQAEGANAIGASAGVLAIVVATATLVPDYTIMLFIWPIRLKWFALVTIALDFIGITQPNAGGHLAHLGGALFGFIYIKQLQKGNDWGRWLNNFIDWLVGLFSGRPRLRVSYSKTENVKERAGKKKQLQQNQEKLDAILDKISKSGYESLTKEEKEFLFKASRETK